jgi:phospholipase C
MRTALLAIVLLVTPVWAAESLPACPFAAGALPADTLPPGTPHGASIPIDHIVVLMQENHSFENYFGHLHPSAQRHLANPDPTAPAGAPIVAFHDPHTCVPHGLDLDHSWTGSHREWDGGAMDGFTAANVDPQDPTGRRTMAYYTRADLPFYYGLARAFGIGARYFCSVLGPTYPNRMYLFAGTSFGHIQNDFPSSPTEFSQPTILNLLDAHGITWREYVSDVPMFIFFAYVRDHPANVVPIAQYFADAAAGTLPQVAFLDARGFGTLNQESDEHPPANVQVGEAFGEQVVAALMASPDWARSALFLTYDEHGGYFDPVPPPPACVPDDVAPRLGPGDTPAAFDRYGFRVPLVVISPYARRHFVSHVVHDHTAILRFIETRFDLPALTRRDANAAPLLEFFHFRRADVRIPDVPSAVVDSIRAAECAASVSGAFLDGR